jgi:hypothetical protein
MEVCDAVLCEKPDEIQASEWVFSLGWRKYRTVQQMK